jgi:hypothetical protein
MNKRAIIISIIVAVITVIAHIGDLRCQENYNITVENNHLKNTGKIANEINAENVMDDKNIMVEMLGRIIQRNLYNACLKIDSQELEDRLERSR